MKRYLQSWIHQSAKTTQRLGGAPKQVAHRIKHYLRDKMGAIEIGEAEYCRALSQASLADAVTVTCKPDSILVELQNRDRAAASVVFNPTGVTFATRGAKELQFVMRHVSEGDALVAERVIAVFAVMVAQKLWGMALDIRLSDTLPVCSRQGQVVRIDLRDLPALRDGRANPFFALLDVVSLRRVQVLDGRIVLQR